MSHFRFASIVIVVMWIMIGFILAVDAMGWL